MDPDDDDVSLPPSVSSFADEGPSDLLSVLNMAASLDGASESRSVELPPSVSSSMPGSAMSVLVSSACRLTARRMTIILKMRQAWLFLQAENQFVQMCLPRPPSSLSSKPPGMSS